MLRGVCAMWEQVYWGTNYSFNMVRIDVSGFTFLTGNYCGRSISQFPYLKYFLHIYLCVVYMCVYVCVIDIHIHHHCLLFCFFDYLELCNQTKQSFKTPGAASFSSPSGYVEKQSILLLRSLGGSAMTWIVQCFALAMQPGWQNFLQEADCIWGYEYAMTLISIEAPEQGLTSPTTLSCCRIS